MDTELLKLLYERSSALNAYWNLYIGVALGLLGLFASGKDFTCTKQMKVIITAGFAVFALSNLDAILSTNSERSAIGALVDAKLVAAATPSLPKEPWVYMLFHLTLDALLLLSFWIVPWLALSNDMDKASELKSSLGEKCCNQEQV